MTEREAVAQALDELADLFHPSYSAGLFIRNPTAEGIKSIAAKLREGDTGGCEQPADDIEVGELWRCAVSKNNIGLWESEWVEVRYTSSVNVAWARIGPGSAESIMPRDEFLMRFHKTPYCRASK